MTISLEPPPTEPLPPRGSERFFLWIAGLGVARSDGWVGGVAAGIAARLRIDALVVRGVLVIAALFGLPMIFLYAAAWALLPDADGRVHARDLLRREYQPVQLGILGAAIVGLVPTAPFTGLIFGAGAVDWSALAVLSWVVGAVITIALLVLIVRAAHRGGAVAEAPAEPEESDPVDAPPAPPEPLPDGVDDPEALAAWRERQIAWKKQNQEWRKDQQNAERAAKEQLRRERRATAAQFSAEAAERRRIRRASNPRAGFAYVAAVIGAALIAGALVGLFAAPGLAAALGLLVAAFVLAVGMVIAGIARRRSGFLAFLTAVVLAGGAVAAAPAALGGDVAVGNIGISNARSGEVRQLFGDLYISLMRPASGTSHPVVVEKNSGYTEIWVEPGVTLELTAIIDDVSVNWLSMTMYADGSSEYLDSGTWSASEGADGRTTTVTETVTSDPLPEDAATPSLVVPVRIEQRTGVIQIHYFESVEESAR